MSELILRIKIHQNSTLFFFFFGSSQNFSQNFKRKVIAILLFFLSNENQTLFRRAIPLTTKHYSYKLDTTFKLPHCHIIVIIIKDSFNGDLYNIQNISVDVKIRK